MIVGVALITAGLAFAVVGVLGWYERLPQNRFAGVRTPATLRDDETFTMGNRVSAPLTIAAGAVATLGGIATMGSPTHTHHHELPGTPLNGPTTSGVIQPP
jgi:uncharacterized membrane protein